MYNLLINKMKKAEKFENKFSNLKFVSFAALSVRRISLRNPNTNFFKERHGINMSKTLGTRISELRKAKGLKQDDIAEALGVSAQAVSKWENDISCPDITALPKLARLLGVTVDELLSGEERATAETEYLPEGYRKKPEDMLLRIKVDDEEEKTKVRVNLPIPLIKILLESGASVDGVVGSNALKNIDFSQIMTMIENGMIGKLVEVDSEGTHVEITVE